MNFVVTMQASIINVINVIGFGVKMNAAMVFFAEMWFDLLGG